MGTLELAKVQGNTLVQVERLDGTVKTTVMKSNTTKEYIKALEKVYMIRKNLVDDILSIQIVSRRGRFFL